MQKGFYFLFILVTFLVRVESKQNTKANAVEEVTDVKDFKKILRTKNNVLVLFYSSQKSASNMLKTFKEAAEIVRGQGTMLLVDCSGDKDKKLCKKLKVNPDPYVLRHYKDGEFHKVYDRKETVNSIVNFMRDPTGDLPWEEESSGVDVHHIPDYQALVRLLKKEMGPVMIMFYAPWCGFCKQLKPEYSAAATSLKGKAVMAAIDVNRPKNAMVRMKFNITGFPTLLYFEKGELKMTYEGENKKDDLINFMNNPTAPPVKPKEEEWSESDNDVIHLTSETFKQFVEESASILVMFYAPWCGHCKKMKPEYEKAAKTLKDSNSDGLLAAVDATKEKDLAKQYNVKGYPTVKYFKNGEFLWDLPSLREASKIVSFMKDPKEPPSPPPPQPDWEEEESEVLFLNVENFKQTLKKKRHVLVMFYAPWCGHCKKAKPEFSAAAEELKDNMKVSFAALDCTKHQAVCSTMEVKGYPTFKYFNYYDKNKQEYSGGRLKNDFIAFMKKMENGDQPPVVKEEKQKSYWDGFLAAEKIVDVCDPAYKNIVQNAQTLLVLVHDGTNADVKLKESFVALATEYPSLATYGSCDARSNKQFVIENKIHSFPSLKLFNKGKVKDFPKSYEKSDMVKFLKKFSPKEEL
ncbi:protein disulfide-isomerase A5 [Cimex lectularius]|uniref:Thioredoxin domain-containing protein n=1 Tax=Cimex lectularius TaxID=79782 RepID=A0A8I6TJ83_CIMLE|nr:protein disulfide-isomerase A5 [Cimex lectularius]